MAAFILNTIKTQLPAIVEKFEPQLEAGLRSSLKALKTQKPEEASLFLANWKKLNAAVESELINKTGARRRKRTRKVHRKH